MFPTDLSQKFTNQIAISTVIMTIVVSLSPATAQVSPIIGRPLELGNAMSNALSFERVQEDAYTLGGGDRVRVDVFEAADYSGEYPVLIDGNLNLPLIGSINVQGMTVEQATQAVSEAYSRVFKVPVVSLTVTAPRPLQVTILGEVTVPGAYQFELLRPGGRELGFQYPTILKAIEMAQGITLTGDLQQIQIRRPQREGTDRIINIDLWDFLYTGNPQQNITLRDGDTIVVPVSSNISPEELENLAATSLVTKAEVARQVTVVGAVNRSGVYVLLGGATGVELRQAGIPTVTTALERSGGITNQADIGNIQVRRRTQNGSEQIIPVNLWKLLREGNFSHDLALQSGDTIYVPTVGEVNPAEVAEFATAAFAPKTMRVYVVGEVGRFGNEMLDLPINTSLNQALLAAGGLSRDAAKRDIVHLIRINPDGTARRQPIRVNYEDGINDETNPLLQNEDVIVVDQSRLYRVARTAQAILSPFAPFRSLIGIFEAINVIE